MQNVSLKAESKVEKVKNLLSKLIPPVIILASISAFVGFCLKYPQVIFSTVRFVLDHPSVMLILIAVSIFWSCVGVLWRILKTRSWVAKYPGWVAFGSVFIASAVLGGGGLVHLVESSYYQNSIAYRVFKITPTQIKPRMVIVADACMPVSFGVAPAKVEDSSVCQTALSDGRHNSIFIDPLSLDGKRFNVVQGSTILHALHSDYLVGVKNYNAKMVGKVVIKASQLNEASTVRGDLAQVPKN
jgi:hypothetical protein